MPDESQTTAVATANAPVTSMQDAMKGALDRALGRLEALPTPVEGKAKQPQQAAGTAPLTPTGEGAMATPGSTPAVDEVAPTPELELEHSTAATPEPETDTAAPPPVWGPQQAIALQEVLNANAAMSAELKALKDAQAAAAAATAQAELPPDKRIESTMHGLQEKLAALESQLARANEANELAQINQHLQTKPDYGILRRIPDSAQRLQQMIRQRQAEARSRGEVAPAFGVEQAAKLLRESVVGNLKQLIADDDIKRELGFTGEPVTPSSVKTPKPAKAITGRHTATGSNQKPQSYSSDAQLRAALDVLNGRG